MFIFIECLRAALSSIFAHQLRSFLTSLGIIVGVASIVAIAYIIQGLSDNVSELFRGLGSDSLTISSFTPQEKQLRGEYARLTSRDLLEIKQRVSGISAVTPIMYSQVNQQATSSIRYGSNSSFTRVFGTTYNYKEIANHTVKYGRFLADSDRETRRRVCIIGEEVRKNLSLPKNPVGKFIEVGGEWLKIVGLMEEKGDLMGFSQDDFVALPYTTMQSLIGNQTEPDIQILLTVDDINEVAAVQKRIEHLLRASRKLAANEENDFKILTPKQLLSGLSDFISTITYFMVGVVSISLLVGGIGIMNVMLVSVNERTKEIGILKSIGAKRFYILLQFLIEALVVCFLGGAVGILFGWGLGIMASIVLNFPLQGLPLWAVALSFSFSALIGIVFGILPAAKAASLDPIEALRYE